MECGEVVAFVGGVRCDVEVAEAVCCLVIENHGTTAFLRCGVFVEVVGIVGGYVVAFEFALVVFVTECLNDEFNDVDQETKPGKEVGSEFHKRPAFLGSMGRVGYRSVKLGDRVRYSGFSKWLTT